MTLRFEQNMQKEIEASNSEAHITILWASFLNVIHITTWSWYIITRWWLYGIWIFMGHLDWTNSLALIQSLDINLGRFWKTAKPFIFSWMSVALCGRTFRMMAFQHGHSLYGSQFCLCEVTSHQLKTIKWQKKLSIWHNWIMECADHCSFVFRPLFKIYVFLIAHTISIHLDYTDLTWTN